MALQGKDLTRNFSKNIILVASVIFLILFLYKSVSVKIPDLLKKTKCFEKHFDPNMLSVRFLGT